MKTNPSDQDPLLDAVFSDEDLADLRSASLEQMLMVARQARQRQRAMRTAGLCLASVAVLIGLLALYESATPLDRQGVVRHTTVTPQHRAPSPAVIPSAAPGVKILTDDELLALFPGRPVGLIGPTGRQRLVFLDGATRSRKP